MIDSNRLLEFFGALDRAPVDEQHLRRLAYVTFGGDSFELMTTLLGTIRSLAEQLAPFYGTTPEGVLRMEVVLPARP